MKNDIIKTVELSKIEMMKILSDVLIVFANQQTNLKSMDSRRAICNEFYNRITAAESSQDAG